MVRCFRYLLVYNWWKIYLKLLIFYFVYNNWCLCNCLNNDGTNYRHIFITSSLKRYWKEIITKLHFIRQKSYRIRGVRINCKKKVIGYWKEVINYFRKEWIKKEKINLTLREDRLKKKFFKNLIKSLKYYKIISFIYLQTINNFS